jgi:hypothetical protein
MLSIILSVLLIIAELPLVSLAVLLMYSLISNKDIDLNTKYIKIKITLKEVK